MKSRTAPQCWRSTDEGHNRVCICNCPGCRDRRAREVEAADQAEDAAVERYQLRMESAA